MSSEATKNFLAVLKDVPKISPECPHVSEHCGGCLLQEYAYDQQLHAKITLLDNIYMQDIKVHSAKEQLGYRSRMDFVLAFEKSGLRVRGSYARVVDIKDCMLLPTEARKAYIVTRDILLTSGLATYNYIIM